MKELIVTIIRDFLSQRTFGCYVRIAPACVEKPNPHVVVKKAVRRVL